MLLLSLLVSGAFCRRHRRSSTNDIMKVHFEGPLGQAFKPIYVRPVKHRSKHRTKDVLVDLLKVLTEDKYQEENVHSPGERQLEAVLANLRQQILPIGFLSNKGRMNRLKKRVIRAQSVKPLQIFSQQQQKK